MSQRPERPLPPKVEMIEVEDRERRSVRTFRTSCPEPLRRSPSTVAARRQRPTIPGPVHIRPRHQSPDTGRSRRVDPGWTLHPMGSERIGEPTEFPANTHRIAWPVDGRERPKKGRRTCVKAGRFLRSPGGVPLGFSVTKLRDAGDRHLAGQIKSVTSGPGRRRA
jgi:hypothetical protein